jgi:uncharacterized repeat protein (TIGR01451 family)
VGDLFNPFFQSSQLEKLTRTIWNLKEMIMIKLTRKPGSIPVAVLCLLALGGAAAFAQRHFTIATGAVPLPEVKVVLVGSVERDSGAIPMEKVQAVNPGEVLDWTITSENAGSGPAHDYKTVGQIPKGTTLIAGSVTADGSTRVVYSIDSGKSYSVSPTIEQKQVDGSVKRVAAPIDMYTHIRYEWADPLASGGKLSASYKVRVK